MNYDQAFDALIGNEGGYSFNANDPGAETMWGITAKVARRNGYLGDMKQLPRETAKGIAEHEYWMPARCDDLPPVLRFQMLDAAYNSGAPQAVLWLQRAVGVHDDGIIGRLEWHSRNRSLSTSSRSPKRTLSRFERRPGSMRTDRSSPRRCTGR